MISVVPILMAVLCGVLAVRAKDSRAFFDVRRETTIVLAAGAFACAALWLTMGQRLTLLSTPIPGYGLVFSAAGFLGLVPFVNALVGMLAVALADSISHSIATLRRILALLMVAMVFVASSEPWVLVVAWGLSPLIVWTELRTRYGSRGVARLFAVFQLPSILLFCGAMVVDDPGRSVWLAATVLAAIGIREAAIPGHSWFLRFVEDAPMGLVVAFVAPQLGVYAHVEVFGDGIPAELVRVVAAFGAVTALVAGALGTVQSSTRRALAYLMMSQTGLVAFGIEGGSQVAFAGSLLAWQVLAVATSGFAMTASALEARRGRRPLSEYSGCFRRTPRMAAAFLMMGLGSVGFPMTLGFVAEDLLVQGSVGEFPFLAFVLIVATALNGMNVMRLFFHLFSGRREHSGETDLTFREAWALSAILLLLLAGGLVPGAITSREFKAAPGQGRSHHAASGISAGSVPFAGTPHARPSESSAID